MNKFIMMLWVKTKRAYLSIKFYSIMDESASGEPIFIIGTGRSGTHFLARILVSHPNLTDLTGGEENHYIFEDVTNYALGVSKPSLNKIVSKYRNLVSKAYPKRLVDQSHPSLWMVERLSQEFPRAKFVAIVRDPRAVAYSTLFHDGVSGWLKKWESFPVPNKMLGIDSDNINIYAGLSIEEKSSIRWAAHVKELDRLASSNLKDKILVVRYEDIHKNRNDINQSLSDFLNLENKFSGPDANSESLHKKNALSQQQVDKVSSSVSEHLKDSKLGPVINDVLYSYDIEKG